MSKKKEKLKGGIKYDGGKLRFDLLPPLPLFELVLDYTMGAVKYEDRNWEKGMSWGRTFSAMMRHAWRWWLGEQRDPDGQHHLAAIIWNAAALIEWEQTHPEFDDRPKYPKKYVDFVLKKIEEWQKFILNKIKDKK